MESGSRRSIPLLLAAVCGALACGGDRLADPKGTLALPERVDFGLVEVGQPASEQLVLENTSRRRITITALTSTKPSMRVEDAAGFTLGPAERRAVTVRFTPRVEGTVEGQLLVETDVAPGKPLAVALVGHGVASFVNVLTPALDFGTLQLHTAQTLQVEVQNPTRLAASIELAFAGEDADEFFSGESGRALTVEPGQTRLLPITFRPVRVGLAEATARIRRCATCPAAEVALRGSGVAGLLDIFPTSLDFGRVALGATAELQVTLRNNAAVPVMLGGATIGRGEGPFAVKDRDFPRALMPGASTTVTVRFTPPATATYAGELRLMVEVNGRSSVDLELKGEGGNTCLALLPRTLDFGTVAEGMSLTREVVAFNRCRDTDITLTELAVRTTQGGFFGLSQAATQVQIPGGQQVPLSVTFTPRSGGGGSAGELSARVQQGGSFGTEMAALVGNGRAFPPCEYRVDPAELAFGRVSVGSEVTLGVTLTNVGAEACFVSRMGLVGGADPAFSDVPFAGGTVAPGAKVFVPVRFRPAAVQASGALLEGLVSHPTRGYFTVPVSGEGAGPSCFTLEPGTVDFGTVRLSCGERLREVVAYNTCASPLTLTSAGLVSATSDELRVAGAPPLPFSLAPGGTASFTVGFAPRDEGGEGAAFQVASAEAGAMTVGLVGTGLELTTWTDRFMQELQGKVDVLFVVDNSSSMTEEQQGLGQNFAAFITAAQGQGVDYHIGVTTTGIDPKPDSTWLCAGGVWGGEAGRLFPADGSAPRIITPATPGAAAVFAHNTAVGTCHHVEQGLEAAYRALSAPLVTSVDDPRTPEASDGNAGFLRPDARLALVFVSDEEDASPESVSFYDTFFRGLKGNDPNRLSISAIIGPEDRATCPTSSTWGSRYLALANATGGTVESICTSDWARSLEHISRRTFPLKDRFVLTRTPEDPAQITVTVDGVPVTSGWTYDARTNSIVFAADAVPPAGSVVEVTYPLGC